MTGWRRHAARSALVLAGVALMISWMRHGPRDQPLRLDLGTPAARLHLTWSHDGDPEPLGGATLDVRGQRVVRHVLRAPNGSYTLQARVERSGPDGGTSETTSVRRVTLVGEETSITIGDR